MAAVFVDESTPNHTDGSVIYSMAAVILMQPQIAAAQLSSLLSRKNPLHWEGEGAVTRERVADLLCEIEAKIIVAAMFAQTHEQEAVRQRLLEAHLLPEVVARGGSSLNIEQRSKAQNDREVAFIRSWYRDRRLPFPAVNHVTKSEPGIGYADAASGIWSDALKAQAQFLDRLVGHGVLVSAWRP